MDTDELAHTASAAVPSRTARKRRKAPRARLPKRTAVRILGSGAMAVSLHGTYGRGKEMVLDDHDWHQIRMTVGDVWLLNANGGRTHWYVRCGAARLARLARQSGARPTASLARILVNAKRGELVLYRDGDPLNLRRANLEVVTKAEAMRRRTTPRSA